MEKLFVHCSTYLAIAGLVCLLLAKLATRRNIARSVSIGFFVLTLATAAVRR